MHLEYIESGAECYCQFFHAKETTGDNGSVDTSNICASQMYNHEMNINIRTPPMRTKENRSLQTTKRKPRLKLCLLVQRIGRHECILHFYYQIVVCIAHVVSIDKPHILLYWKNYFVIF